jgi:hypothetical protein
MKGSRALQRTASRLRERPMKRAALTEHEVWGG